MMLERFCRFVKLQLDSANMQSLSYGSVQWGNAKRRFVPAALKYFVECKKGVSELHQTTRARRLSVLLLWLIRLKCTTSHPADWPLRSDLTCDMSGVTCAGHLCRCRI